jgi:hypothetical protein
MYEKVWNDHVARRYDSSSAHMHRFVWPSELDLMAGLAGLELREQWEDWNEKPFTAESRSHVSVWQKPVDRAAGFAR